MNDDWLNSETYRRLMEEQMRQKYEDDRLEEFLEYCDRVLAEIVERTKK